MKKRPLGGYEFSSGRKFGATYGVIGLGEDLSIFEGYDAGIEDERPLTREERIELADFMITRWQLYKSFVKGT